MPDHGNMPTEPILDAPSRLEALGGALPDIEQLFTGEGALGIAAIDASGLEEIETRYGGDALQRAMTNLAHLVGELLGDRLGVSDRIVTGETGRSELLVLLYREPDEVEFYQRELPDIRRRLLEGIARRGHRVAYPYLKTMPRLAIGTSASLRNPTIRAETQLRAALEQARSDAELEARIEARSRRRKLFELVLRGAIRSVYEPIVECKSRTVFAYEALARGPEGSPLHSPAVLFAMAGEEDLLFQLDCLCRRSGIAGARDLPKGTKLFLNVRPTSIHDPSFRAEALTETLGKLGLAPSDVVFEISEQESIGNFEIFREVSDYYKKLGFQIALDDTGAGYQSLEAVMELSPDFIKVDKAFVQGIDADPARQELVRALRSVADRIGALIVGEGLDTLEELETLSELGIPFGQGWLFGKPQPLSAGF
jgi:EAL domain-containing protein (putative c-di-GMP-specific phosphodiesterase class I)